jgi:hypothetical protein
MAKKQDYKDFEESLTENFEDLDLKSIKQLARLMKKGGYRRKKIDNEVINYDVSQLQLDFAWDFLKSKQKVKKEYRKPVKTKEIRITKAELKRRIGKTRLPKGYKVIKPKGFKKKQIRDKKGRIVKWI